MPSMPLRDEVAQHLFGDVEIRDHPLLQRPNDANVAWRAPEHRLRFAPHGDDGLVRLMNRDDGGFIDDNPLAADEHQRIRRPQVDREVIREFFDPALEQAADERQRIGRDQVAFWVILEFLDPALEQHHPLDSSRSTMPPMEAPVLLSHRPSCQAAARRRWSYRRATATFQGASASQERSTSLEPHRHHSKLSNFMQSGKYFSVPVTEFP